MPSSRGRIKRLRVIRHVGYNIPKTFTHKPVSVKPRLPRAGKAITFAALTASVLEYRHLHHAAHRFAHRLERGIRESKPDARPEGALYIVVGMTIELEDLGVSDEVLADLEDEIRSILEEYGQRIKEDAQSIAPVQTGFLRDSVYYFVLDPELVLIAGDEAPYALYVEEGTSHQASQPFLNPAITAWAGEMNTEIDDAVFNALNENIDGEGDDGGDDIVLDMESTLEEL